MKDLRFTLPEIRAALARGATAESIVGEADTRADAYGDSAVWISRVPRTKLLARARALDALSAVEKQRLPLFGVPFAVKDNIDVAGLPTTAACPAFSYAPKTSAPAVARLEAAGAVVLGKTNLDQFATGLNGTRSPHGAPRSVFNKDYISGGSSSGSAVTVAAGLAAFALGTDTAGSGRIPAAFNNIVGLKPTRGIISATGVVPACRSLDCISIFALTVEDAMMVCDVAAAFDASDVYSRPRQPCPPATPIFRFAVPAALNFFGDAENERLFQEAVVRLESTGGTRVVTSFAPFQEIAALLYEGPWVAERAAAVGDFIASHREACDPTVAAIVLGGRSHTAVDTFRALYRLEALKRAAQEALTGTDCFLLPTAPTIFTVEEMKAEPIALNSRLGLYTNFMNLLDMAGIAVPAGINAHGLPFGVTLAGPAFSENKLAGIAARLASPSLAPGAPWLRPGQRLEIAVVGAHMSGLPLNHELTSRGGRFVERTATAARYSFYALAGGPPFRPGLVRGGDGAIDLEIWSLPADQVGSFLAGVPSPLAIGTVELADGRKVKGFLCEPAGLDGARDITATGGWRNFLAAKNAPKVQGASA